MCSLHKAFPSTAFSAANSEKTLEYHGSISYNADEDNSS